MDLFLPMDERRQILREHAHVFGTPYFIETGTNDGTTTWTLRSTFERLYTIELDEVLWRQACQRYEGSPHITCIHADSGEALPKVLHEIDAPALVWLDGHFCGSGTAWAEGAPSTPIRKELAALFEDGRPHVILIDDARVFEGGAEHAMYPHYADYPSLEWVECYATDHGYRYNLRDDIIRLFPK